METVSPSSGSGMNLGEPLPPAFSPPSHIFSHRPTTSAAVPATPSTVDRAAFLPSPPKTSHQHRPHQPEVGVPSRRYPLNAQMVSDKPPEHIFRALQLALGEEGIIYTPAAQPLCVQGACDDVLFEAEVVKIPRLNMHAVHFRRVRGDATVYQKLCTVLIQLIRL